MKKKPRASAAEQGARRAWLISDTKSFGFHGFSLDPWLLSVALVALGLLGSHWL